MSKKLINICFKFQYVDDLNDYNKLWIYVQCYSMINRYKLIAGFEHVNFPSFNQDINTTNDCIFKWLPVTRLPKLRTKILAIWLTYRRIFLWLTVCMLLDRGFTTMEQAVVYSGEFGLRLDSHDVRHLDVLLYEDRGRCLVHGETWFLTLPRMGCWNFRWLIGCELTSAISSLSCSLNFWQIVDFFSDVFHLCDKYLLGNLKLAFLGSQMR